MDFRLIVRCRSVAFRVDAASETLAPGGRISLDLVREGIERLSSAWTKLEANETQDTLSAVLGKERLDGIDFFDQVQLASGIRVCRNSRSLSDSGRRLFGVSRGHKASTNDADRLRKYLNRFGMGWSQIVPDPQTRK